MQVYINRAGQQFGPYSMEQVTQGLAEGSLVDSDLAWREGADQWIPLSQFMASRRPDDATTPLPDTTPTSKKSKPSTPTKTPAWLIRVGIGLGAAAAIALVWVLFFKGSSATGTEEPIRPPTAEEEQSSAKKIESAIRKTINKPKGALASRDLRKVTELELWDSAIYDLRALADLKQIKKLDLAGNHINDLNPLASLTNLEHLSLDRNQVTDLTTLANLRNLENLGLENNRITDLTPLTQLTQLKFLQLKNNPGLTKAQVKKLQQALPRCNIDANAGQ